MLRILVANPPPDCDDCSLMRFEPSAAKRALLEKLLEQSMVLVTLDARANGVHVPQHLLGDPQLRLNLSYRFGLPLDITDDGIRATLTFQGNEFECALPWDPIYMLVSHATGQPFLFPADIPVEAKTSLAQAEEHSYDEESAEAAAPKLTLVASQAGGVTAELTASAPTDEPPPDAPPPNRGHLRVVK